MQHAELAPSSSGRWSVCTASVKFIRDNPQDMLPSGGKSADEGTLAHALLTARLLRQPDPAGVTTEMLSYVQGMLIWLESMKPMRHSLTLVDEKVPLFYSPEENGTLDVAMVGTDTIIVADLKYGVAISVEAQDNTQLLIYAQSLINRLRKEGKLAPDAKPRVGLYIYQPRDSSNPQPVREWVLSMDELSERAAEIAMAAGEIDREDTQFVAGAHCAKYFCPARGCCPHYAAFGFDHLPDVDHTPAKLSKPSALAAPEALTREQRQKVLAAADDLREWLKAVEALEVETLQRGEAPMRFKLVAGRANRQWSSPAAAEAFLRDHLTPAQMFPPSDIISPAQAEKALSPSARKLMDAQSASLITKPEGKPTLVPMSDKRPALSFTLMPAVSDGWDSI